MAGLTARLPGKVLRRGVCLAPGAPDCQGAVTPEPAVGGSECRLDEGSSLTICCTTAKVTLYVGCVSECDSVFVCTSKVVHHLCLLIHIILGCLCMCVLASVCVCEQMFTLTFGEPHVFTWLSALILLGF